jgi:hypothetical protein
MSSHKTRVYITVDVECAEERRVGGVTQPCQGYDLRVWGRFHNQKREFGIDLIMRELEARGHRATFFVEPLGSSHFGIDGLREVCTALRGRGHDVQLHTHPVQKQVNWWTQGLAPPADDMADYSVADQTLLLEEGLGLLEQCGVPRSELRAFRAGNFGANNSTWQALARAKLRLDSSFNPNYLRKNCRIEWPRMETGLFDTGVGVWELPVSNFREADGTFRHLQLTAVSLREIEHYLDQARSYGIREVTIVTHSFEFFFVDSIAQKTGRPNRINVHRLRGLARLLRKREADFEVETVGALAARLPVPPPDAVTAVPAGKRIHRVGRLLEQGFKRVQARLPI